MFAREKLLSFVSTVQKHYGLGANTDEPGAKAITKTKVADGLKWIVSCIDAGFFLVPDTKAVSNGILLFMRTLMRKLNSYKESCSFPIAFLNNVPESTADICVSNNFLAPS